MEDCIRVGFPAPLTGVSELEANEQRLGALTAIDEFNESGGALGMQAKLIERDTKTSADLSESMTIELIEKEKVHVLVGALQSEHQIRISRASSPRKICYNAISQSDSILYQEHRSPYTFHEGQNPHMTVGTVGRYCFSHFGEKVAFLNWDSDFGYHSVRALEHVGNQIGIRPVYNVFHPLGTKDYRNYLQDIEKLKPEVIIFNNFGLDQLHCAQQARELGLFENSTIVFPNISVTNLANHGQDLFKNCIGSVAYTWQLESVYESAKKFNRIYKKQSGGKSPSSYSAYGYTGTRTLLEAIRKSNSLESDLIAKAMLELRFDYCRGLQYYRRLDHQSVQIVTVVEVKAKEYASTEDDYFQIVDIANFLGERSFFASREVI